MFASQLPGGAGGVRLADPVRLRVLQRGGPQRGRRRAAERDPGQPGAAGIHRLRPEEPHAPRSIASPPAAKPPITHEFLAGFDKELTPQLLGERHGHLPQDDRSAVDAADRRDAGRTTTQTATLTGNAPEIGAYSVPFYALSAAAVPPGGGKVFTVARGLSPALSRVRGQRDQAPVEPLDGAGRLLDQRLARVLRRSVEVDARSDAGAGAVTRPAPFAGPQVDGGAVVRSSTGSGKSGIYMVAPAYQFIANGVVRGDRGA